MIRREVNRYNPVDAEFTNAKMDHSMNALNELDLFVAVCRTLNFKLAASSLGIPPSTLSRRIAQLERELGVQLFVRTTRRVELTAAAKLYLSRCEPIVDAARDARAEVQGMVATPTGRLRVSMEADVAVTLLAPAIAKLQRLHPDITVDLDLSPRRVDLIAEGFDAAVRIGRLPDSTLVAREIAALPVGLYASKNYLRHHREPSIPADLARHRRLHLLHQQDDGAWHLHAGRKRATVASEGAHVFANSMAMLCNLMRLDMGVAMMDELMASDDLARGRIKRVLPTWSLPSVPISILTPSRLVAAKTRAFIDVVTAQLHSK